MDFADAGRLGVETHHVFIPAIGEELAVYIASAADGFFSRGAFGGGTVAVSVEIDADFVFETRLMKRG